MTTFLPGLLAASELNLVVDNAKSHSDLYKNLYRRERLSLLSADLEKLNTSGRFNAICECFQEINPKSQPRHMKHPRFDRWGPEESTEKTERKKWIPDSEIAMKAVALADDQAPCPPQMLTNASMPQRQESVALEEGGSDDTDLRPPSLMNASMPHRQESEDPEMIRSMLAGRGRTRGSLLDIDSDDSISGSDEVDHHCHENDEFCWASSLLPHSRPNATMTRHKGSQDPGMIPPPPPPQTTRNNNENAPQPMRQASEDPEIVMALLRSLKDLEK